MDELKTLIPLTLHRQSPLTKKQLVEKLQPIPTKNSGVVQVALEDLKNSGAIDSKSDPNCSRFRLIWFPVKNESGSHQITSDFACAIPDPDVRSQFIDLASYDPESALRYLNFVYTHEEQPDAKHCAKFTKRHISNRLGKYESSTEV